MAERSARLHEASVRLAEGLSEAGVPSSLRRCPAGSLLHDGAWGRRSLRVLRGGVARASVPIPGEDGNTFSRLIGPWEPFGGPWLGEVGRRDSRVEAAADCEVLEFGGGALAKALRGHPALATEFAALLEFELLERQELCEVLVPRQTDRRLALLLVLLAGKFGEGPGAEPPLRIGLRLTHWDLAGMVAATRESVTAALRTLRRAGLIVAERQRVVVPDPEALAGYAG